MYDAAGAVSGQTGEQDGPPYQTGLEALRDGWRLLGMSQLLVPGRGLEYSTSYHDSQCVFERLVARRPGRKER